MNPSTVAALGIYLRTLRQASGQTVREVAAAANMDPALLSKIENGNRLPTQAQTTALARVFKLPESDTQAQRITVDFLARYGRGEPTRKALPLIQKALDGKGEINAG